jgi:hypothetical protein
MTWFPPEPDVPASQRGTASGPVRYEDVAQDGRVMLMALPHSIGLTVWQGLLQHDAGARATQRQGVIPVLTRFAIEGTDSPISVRNRLEFSGCYQLAHTVDDAGAVNRLVLNMWTRAKAPIGRTYGPPPPGHGELAPIGRVFAEHVFTRLFAKPAERKVLRFDVDGRLPVPPDRYAWQRPDALLAGPLDAEPVDKGFVPDGMALAFGVMHTDSNKHVNSLVYPRLFEEAALRRFAAAGQPTTVLARTLEVAYRKPFFAGERTRVLVRAFRAGSVLTATGAFVPEPAGGAVALDPAAPETIARAHVFVRMRFW